MVGLSVRLVAICLESFESTPAVAGDFIKCALTVAEDTRPLLAVTGIVTFHCFLYAPDTTPLVGVVVN